MSRHMKIFALIFKVFHRFLLEFLHISEKFIMKFNFPSYLPKAMNIIKRITIRIGSKHVFCNHNTIYSNSHCKIKYENWVTK